MTAGARCALILAVLTVPHVAVVADVATVQQSATAQHESEALRTLTDARFAANAANDRAFYERLLADNFQVSMPNEFPPLSKQAYLDAEFPPGRPGRPPATTSDFRAAIADDTAVVSYVVEEPYPLGAGQNFKAVSRRVDTYVRRGGRWRLLSMTVAEPPSWPVPVAVDPRLYREYAGVYEITPETQVSVTVRDGRLLAKITGQPEFELLAENETTFFDRNDSPLARTVFERDGTGKVVAQVYRSMGQTLVARKVR